MSRSLFLAAFILTGSTLAIAAEPPKTDDRAKLADKSEKMICKRFLETGSLVKGYRACKTKRDWERERDAIRSVTSNSGSCAGQGISGGC
jgi:hypothetical protein